MKEYLTERRLLPIEVRGKRIISKIPKKRSEKERKYEPKMRGGAYLKKRMQKGYKLEDIGTKNKTSVEPPAFSRIPYSEYLQTDHWKTFRKSVYAKRNRCQKCGKRNVQLNLHHITYKNLWKETGADVLVLCRECHRKGHETERWKSAMKKGKELRFVRKAKTEESKIYEASQVFRECNRCGEKHPVFYKLFKNGTKHLAMACPSSKPRTQYVKFEELKEVPVIHKGKK